MMFALAGTAAVTLGGNALAGTVRVGGTGIGLAAAQRLGEDFAAANPGTRVELLPSLSTSGGIRALREQAIDVAIAATRLSPEDRARGLDEAACLTTALVFVTSLRAPPGIARTDLPRLYAETRPTWPDGTPIKIILRVRTGSEVPYLSAAIPGLGPAFDLAYNRPAVPVSATDQENADLAQKTSGSFAIATLLQVKAEKLNLRALALDGVMPTAETIADKSYPFPLRICLVLSASPSAELTKFLEHVRSPEGQAILRSLDTVPSN